MVAASVWYRAALAALLLTPLGTPAAHAQDWLAPVPHFDLASDPDDLTIRQHAEALKPVTVAGKCGAFVGRQDGSFEAWTWPVKLLSHFRMVAELKDYSVPIDVNDQAAEVEVAPDHTTITFAHASFTIREILFAIPCTQTVPGGVMALFQIDATRLRPRLKARRPAPDRTPASAATTFCTRIRTHSPAPSPCRGLSPASSRRIRNGRRPGPCN
jgi:hypothetical protein